MKTNKYGVPPPNNRLELEHNMYLILEDTNRRLDSNNDSLIQNVLWATVPHLRKIKKLPNGRINLVTINEMIRLQGNMMKWREPVANNNDNNVENDNKG